jgi:hypothetical protein
MHSLLPHHDEEALIKMEEVLPEDTRIPINDLMETADQTT